MSRRCELSGVGVQSGNNVSHSQRKTRRKFLPNLHSMKLTSESLGVSKKFRVVARMIKTLEICGGLDNYLLKTKDSLLSKAAVNLKKLVKAGNKANNSNEA